MPPRSGSVDEEVHVELFVRSLSPRDSRRRIESIVDRLDALVAEGAVDHYRVRPTGTELPATPADAITEYGTYLLGRVAAFQEWARATDRCVEALFERRTVSSQFTGDEHDALVLPTVVMAEYEGRNLRFVTPCVDDGENTTVRGRLEDLAAGRTVPRENLLPRAKGSPSFEPPTRSH